MYGESCTDCEYVSYAMCSLGHELCLIKEVMEEEDEMENDEWRIENAKISSVSLTMEDHGCLSFWIMLEGAGWGCGFGGYKIGRGYLGADEFSAEYGDGLEAMMRIMDTVGVSKWEDLKGKYVRCKSKGWGSTGIDIIGNIMEDKWFNIRQFFAEKTEQHKQEKKLDK